MKRKRKMRRRDGDGDAGQIVQIVQMQRQRCRDGRANPFPPTQRMRLVYQVVLTDVPKERAKVKKKEKRGKA